MTILYTTDARYLDHDTGRHHPERPARLTAVEAGIESSGVAEAVVRFEAIPASPALVAAAHPGAYLAALDRFVQEGGGHLDADTVMSAGSFDAAVLAAGAGIEAVRRLRAGEGDVAFCAVRPPGHHATAFRPMGFCLINNVAVTAAALADAGERVAIVDYDAHHGNGTQDIFYADDRVFYVSLHQYPFYPGTGARHEAGEGAGAGRTLNVPLPEGATGDVYREALAELVLPAFAAFDPTWLLISAGYDAHRRDPLTGLGLAAGDFADITAELLTTVAPARTVLFLEGGYDLEALTTSVAATCSTLAGEHHRPEPATSGGPGLDEVARVRRFRDELGYA